MTVPASASERMEQVDQHAPRVRLFVEGEEVADQILADIRTVKHEDSLFLTDEMRIDLVNEEGRYTDAVMWGHGNEVEAWYGYGQEMFYIGRVELIRHMPDFPSDGIMTLKLVGRDKSWRMKKEPPRITGGRQPTRRSEVKSQWTGPLSAYLKQVAKKYGFKTFISKKFDSVREKFIQKRGQTDFQVVQALANYHYASFRVEYRIESPPRNGSWYLVFTDLDESEQDYKYTFFYKKGEESTILGVNFEFGISETITEVKAFYWDPNWTEPDEYKTRKKKPKDIAVEAALAVAGVAISGEADLDPILSKSRKRTHRGRRVGAWRTVSASDYKKVYEDAPVVGADLAAEVTRETGVPISAGTTIERAQRLLLNRGDAEAAELVGRSLKKKKKLKKDLDPFKKSYRSQTAKLDEAPTPTKLRLVIGGHSIEILTRPFANAEEARDFILAWIKNNQNNFITAKGSLPGIYIKAGETHALEGPLLGHRFSGDYYFTSVTQVYSDSGWMTEFKARKVLTGEWLEEQRQKTLGLTGAEEI